MNIESRPEITARPLRVFLCHASGDKLAVRDLCQRLKSPSVDVWLDEEQLLPGQDWDLEIRQAVRRSDVVLVCVSRASLTKAGYVQKEIRDALDIAEQQPEGTLFLIPVRLEECEMPDRLRRWLWVDLFQSFGYERLVRALQVRRESLGISHRADSTAGLMDHLTDEDCKRINATGMFQVLRSGQRFDSIGDLARLKRWLNLRGRVFTDPNAPQGPPQPRGLLLVGVPGCGKSAIAIAAAGEWDVPLFRLNLGSVFSGTVGQSEFNLREGLAFAEKLAPCILLVDELDVRITGFGYRENDGISTRVLSGFLNWMTETTRPIFVIATASDSSRLPPELLRRGRFDEVFFIDLPDEAARLEILEIQLRNHHLYCNSFDLGQYATATEGFTGADLEDAVKCALYDAFAEGRNVQVADRHLHAAISLMVPLSRSISQQIARLREDAQRMGWSIG